MAQRVHAGLTAWCQLFCISNPPDGLSHLPPSGDAGYGDQRAVIYRTEAGGRDQRGLRFGMNRNCPGPSALALVDAQRRAVGIQMEVPRFQRQRLGNSETGPPLLQHQQSGLGLGVAAISALTSTACRYSGSV